MVCDCACFKAHYYNCNFLFNINTALGMKKTQLSKLSHLSHSTSSWKPP